MPGSLIIPGLKQLPGEDKVMTTATIRLMIAFAGLWLALPAAAQFEIDPDHFDDPPAIVTQHPEQAKGSTRIPLAHRQIPHHRAQELKGTKSPANASRPPSAPAAVQDPRADGSGRAARKRVARKTSQQSQLTLSHRPDQPVPQ
jgi:hypothetical protein